MPLCLYWVLPSSKYPLTPSRVDLWAMLHGTETQTEWSVTSLKEGRSVDWPGLEIGAISSPPFTKAVLPMSVAFPLANTWEKTLMYWSSGAQWKSQHLFIALGKGNDFLHGAMAQDAMDYSLRCLTGELHCELTLQRPEILFPQIAIIKFIENMLRILFKNSFKILLLPSFPFKILPSFCFAEPY